MQLSLTTFAVHDFPVSSLPSPDEEIPPAPDFGSRKACVLFVDDEISVRDAIRRTLSGRGGDWTLLFAASGAEALHVMAGRCVDVVIADMRMPGMDGATLLEHVRQAQPSAVRIILSGYTDAQSLGRVIGPAHQYYHKPCPAPVLAEAISRALAVRRMLRSDAILAEVAGARALPSMPGAMAALIAELQAPQGCAATVARIVASDVGLSAQVLKLVNSGFFALPQPVSDILQAVRMLGFDTLGTLVVLGRAFETFRSAGLDVAAINRLARRSLQIGELARRIAQHEHLPPLEVEQARCAGILAHVGTLILLANRPAEMLRIQRRLDETGGRVTDWEERTFGTSHAHISAALLSLWGFSDGIVEAVLFHHQPSGCVCNCASRVAALTAVHAAQHLVKPVPKGGDAEAFWRRGLDGGYLESLGVAGRVPVWGALAAGLEER